MDNLAPASLPAPPYYAVVFTSVRTGDNGYGARVEQMLKLAAYQPGFLGVDPARDADGAARADRGDGRERPFGLGKVDTPDLADRN